MGEVTVEVDAEVAKQDVSLEPLPEPLLIILSPPPPFLPVPGEPTMFWHKWLKAFEHYVEALGEDELVDSSKRVLFQNCLGLEGQRVFATLIPGETTYAAAVSALTVYFCSDRGSQVRRLQFHQRAQMPGETADLFVSALEELLRPCNYGDLQDELILDQLIEKTNCPQLGERLLSERETLTRDKALVIGKEVEFALNESEPFGFHEVSVDIGDDLDPPVQIKRKRGRPRRGEGRPKEHTKPRWTKTPTRSARSKDNGCYSNDALYYCENEDPSKSAGDKEGNDNNGALSSQKMEEEGCDNASDDDDEDEDFYPSKLKGPYCPICVGKRFRDANKLARHMRTHTKEKPFGCPVCVMAFSQSYHMTRHMRKQHGAGRYICPMCGKSLESFAGLQSHKRTHASGVLRCREKFTDNDAFCGHVASHDDHPTQTEGRSPRQSHFCPICVGRRFRGPNKLARHMRTHTKEKPFSCPVCAMTFSQSYHMTRHLRKQHGLGQYICDKCGKSLGSWLELKAHKKTHAVEGLTCLSCDKQFKEKAALVSHLKLHKKVQSSPRSLVCSDCGKRFGRMYHLKRHIVTHRKATDGEVYACPDCQKTFAFPEDLNKHLEIHVKENNGTCPKCNETFGSPEELETHMGVHEKSYACNTCGKKFKVEYAHVMVHDRRESRCPHCDGVFLQLTALKYHLRTHTDERPYQCTCCIETFEEQGELQQHRLKHRKFKRERPYSCTRCDCAFPTLIELTDHMSSHDGEQPMNCPVCGRTFLNKNKLEKHLSIHSGERPHLCAVCGNGFPSAASLKLHVHIHTGEKPFKCLQCSKSFRSSSGLRLHGRQHMEVRPSYECPECGRTYGRMTELKMHQRYHTGDKPYACTCCSKRFISKDKLNSDAAFDPRSSAPSPLCLTSSFSTFSFKRLVLPTNTFVHAEGALTFLQTGYKSRSLKRMSEITFQYCYLSSLPQYVCLFNSF
uniref:C2H2-type domain-containing protein n=1 Tax=Cyclopterus lumpus TaxID=8103 RepID=A0A8C2WBI2_CYCLU